VAKLRKQYCASRVDICLIKHEENIAVLKSIAFTHGEKMEPASPSALGMHGDVLVDEVAYKGAMQRRPRNPHVSNSLTTNSFLDGHAHYGLGVAWVLR
jgi:hypothetical protein